MKDSNRDINLKAQQILRKRIRANYIGASYEHEMAQVFSSFLFTNNPDWHSEVDEMRGYLQEIIFMLGTKEARSLVKAMKLGIELDEYSTVVFRLMQLEGFLREIQYRLEDTMELFTLLNCDLDKKWIKNLIEHLESKQ